MNKCEITKKNKCIQLYKNRLKCKDTQQKLTDSNISIRQNSNDVLILNLDKWKLLSHGGAFWIFHLKKYQSVSVNKYEQNGEYVFRLRQLKWLHKLVDIRTQMILQSLNPKQQILHNNKKLLQIKHNHRHNQNNFTQLYHLQRQLQSQEKQLLKYQTKEKNPLTILLTQIYDEFLNNNVSFKQQTQNPKNPNNPYLYNENYLLPKISKAIVRQSEPFYIHIADQQEINIFIQFIIRQLISHNLQSKMKKLKLYPLKNDEIESIIRDNFQNFPINYELLRQLVKKQQICISFQENLLHFTSSNPCKKQNQMDFQSQIQNLKKNLLTDPKSDMINQIHIGQVFEFKPKTILPDIYTQTFIDRFVQKYRNCEFINQLANISQNNQVRQNTIFPLIDKDKEQKLNDNSTRSQQSIEQKIKQTIIRQIQTTIDKIDPHKLLISSTRWFKKNCLQTGKKKKNQNPMQYFINCLTKKDHFIRQNVDYYNKKHLRKVQIIKIVEVNKVQNQEGKCFKNKKKHSSLQEYKNDTNKQFESLHNKIISNICSRQSVETQSLRYQADKKIQFQQQKIQQQQNLYLIEEILAIQLIDVIDALSLEKHKSLEQTGLSLAQNYIGILQIQNISHNLVALSSNTKINPLSIIQTSSISTQKIFPSKSFQSIKHAFSSKIYSKSLKLSLSLKNIINQSPHINQLIEQTFSSLQIQQIHEIKKKIFFLSKFLISLTWKDISILVSQNIISTISNNNIQSLNLKSENQKQIKLNLNQIEAHKQLVTKIVTQSSKIQRKIISCSIIDYNLKTLQNIDKNVQKDLQFLHNFLKHKLDKKF